MDSIFLDFLLEFFLVVLITSFFLQAEEGIRDLTVTGVQTCALPISVLGDEGVGVAAVSRAVGSGRSLEGAPRRESRHVSVAGGVRRNAVSLVEVGASQISRVA